ncbi:MAG: hypothetical protein ABIS03_00925 [Gemmatimonadaceae bacterium]
MTDKSSEEQMDHETGNSSEPSTQTRSGNPNATDPTRERDTAKKSGYGGEMGQPRTSSDQPDDSDKPDS